MDLDSFLVSLYVLVDDWWQEHQPSSPPKPGRPALLSDPEVITLAILAQWPRFRSERDFWRFASAHLRPYFPNLCTQGQFNRRVRALELELRALQQAFAKDLSKPSAVYGVLDTTLVPAVVRVRASRKGLFAGQASFGRSASKKTEWVYGFKVALVVDPEGVVSAYHALAPAACDQRPIGEALVASDRHEAYLADKGFTGVQWERRWLEEYGALVALHPEERLPPGLVEGGSAMGSRQAPDHRGGDLPAQGLLRPGAPPSQDPRWTAGAPCGQGCGVHLRPTDQRLSRSTAPPPGGPAGLAHCTSVV
jgi:hypothetical protein